MSFDTPGYALFLCAVALLYRVCPRQFRWALLLFASLFFYACWSAPLTLVILGVVLLTYGCAWAIEKAKSAARNWRRFCRKSRWCRGMPAVRNSWTVRGSKTLMPWLP